MKENQGRNEVRWRPEQEVNLAPRCWNLRSFRKQICCIDESTCDIVRTFWRPPQWFGTPIVIQRLGSCAPLAPLVTTLKKTYIRKSYEPANVGRGERWGLSDRVLFDTELSMLKWFVTQLTFCKSDCIWIISRHVIMVQVSYRS